MLVARGKEIWYLYFDRLGDQDMKIHITRGNESERYKINISNCFDSFWPRIASHLRNEEETQTFNDKKGRMLTVSYSNLREIFTFVFYNKRGNRNRLFEIPKHELESAYRVF